MKSRKQFKNDDYNDISHFCEEKLQHRSSRFSEDATTDDYEEEKILHKKRNNDNDFRKKYKTEICKFWSINQVCKFGEKCAFAHGNAEMRQKKTVTSNYKTKKCKQFFEIGYCAYGMRCQFSHILKIELESSNNFSYRKTLEILSSKSIELENIEDLFKFKRPRLRTFENIVNGKTTSTNLIEDVLELKKCFENDNNPSLENYQINIIDKDIDKRSRFLSC